LAVDGSHPARNVPAHLSPLSASPRLVTLFEQLYAATAKVKLDRRLVEIVWLASARAWNCEYQWRVHEPRAIVAGVPLALIDAIRLNNPTFSGAEADQESVARFARLTYEGAAVPDDLSASIRSRLGAAHYSELLAVSAMAASTALLLNARVVEPAPFVATPLPSASPDSHDSRAAVQAVR